LVQNKIVVELLNVPENINAFILKHTMFKDMPHNQMAVIMLIDGFPKNNIF
jgi:hypothetical protein